MLSKTLRCLLILACAVLLPLYAQTSKPVPPGTANETVGTKPSTHHNMHPAHTAAKAKSKARLHDYAASLGALLADTQGKATLTADAWKKIGNEANALANKTYAAASASGDKTAKKAAADARGHVREMREAAMKGDADGAKTHAGMALPFVYTLIDWSTPAKS